MKTPYLLIALSIAAVLIDHIWSSCLCLSLKDCKPQLLGLHHFPSSTILFITLVQLLKLIPPAVSKSRTLVRTHERPISILFHTLHEEVRYPHGIEQVPGSLEEERNANEKEIGHIS